jgi:hypothetical protein
VKNALATTGDYTYYTAVIRGLNAIFSSFKKTHNDSLWHIGGRTEARGWEHGQKKA